jgi:LysM repeat protein
MIRTILVVQVLFMAFVAEAQLKAFKNTIPDSYNFWLYHPVNTDVQDTVQQALPVLIFLHGRSLTGSNMEKVRRYGVIDALEKGRKVDAIVVAPQCPAGSSWNPARVARLLDWIQQNYHTDTSRVYVAGMSLGGYGTMDFVGTYPGRIAAAAALCGGGTPSLACNLTAVPLWVMHGTADRHVPISASKKMIAAMTDCGDTSRLRFTPLKGMDHGDLARVFYTQTLYDWLFLHSLNDSNRVVDRTVELHPQSLRTVYADLNTRGGSITVDNSAALGSSSERTSASGYYTIKKGDTLGAIARKHNTTVKKLCQLNGIKETTILQIGQKIKLP